MDTLKEIGNLIVATITTARACKDAFNGVKAYQRHPMRFIYALNELREETVELRCHVAKLDNLIAEMCAACIPRAETNGIPEEIHHAHVAGDP